MVTRSYCLCDGEYIGIEYIYTVIDGMQINDKEKLAWMRAKARAHELFCPCGCGSNLTVVAGDRNLREQHFRLLQGNGSNECHYMEEGETSIDSKVVLKCWLDEKLSDDNMKARVPICDASDSNRKYEFTFLSQKNGIAVNYCRHRYNLSEDKLGILEQNSAGINVIHIVDQDNEAINWQYPEGMMKVQDWQGYCLALQIEGRDYEKAKLRALFYAKDLDGRWNSILFANSKLKDYEFDEDGKLIVDGERVADLAKTARKQYEKQQEEFGEQREEHRRLAEKQREQKRQEWLRRQKEQEAEEERRKAEEARRWEEIKQAREQRKKEKEAEEARKKVREEEQAANLKKSEEEFWKSINDEFARNDKQVISPEGARIVKCRKCGMIGETSMFSTYGGPQSMNYGICTKCMRKR